MGAENKEQLNFEACDWCSGSSSLNVGPGIFRDIDWEPMAGIGIGIPVCGGCGGLGTQYESEDFKSKVKAIGDLRYQFYESVRAKNLKKQLKAVEKLDRQIKKLVEEYGTGTAESFAQAVAEGGLNSKIEYYKGLH